MESFLKFFDIVFLDMVDLTRFDKFSVIFPCVAGICGWQLTSWFLRHWRIFSHDKRDFISRNFTLDDATLRFLA